MRYIKKIALAFSLAVSCLAQAATLNVSNVPLTSSSAIAVKPNLLFTIDDSGSMGLGFIPDNYNYLQNIANSLQSSAFTPTAMDHRELYEINAYNKIHYDPNVRYYPPAFFDDNGLNTTAYPSMDGTAVGKGSDGNSRNWKKMPVNAMGYDTLSIYNCSPEFLTVDNSSTPTRYYCNMEDMASYWWGVAPEYCSDKDLTNCTVSSTGDSTYKYPALFRYCSGTTNCQGKAEASRPNARVGSPPRFTITVSDYATAPSISSITIDGKNVLSEPYVAPDSVLQGGVRGINLNKMTLAIAQNINKCYYKPTGACTTSGWYAVRWGTNMSTIGVYAPDPISEGLMPTVVSSDFTITPGPIINASKTTYGNSYAGEFHHVNITRANTSYTAPGSTEKNPSRTDCAGTTCTYEEEMTNYGNWFAYYSTRMNAMKTYVSFAFKPVGNNIRVGFTNLVGNAPYTPTSKNYLQVSDFSATQKAKWYDFLFAQRSQGGTPLREALAKNGKVYAGMNPFKLGVTDEPLQYSCQQNYSLITTDGWWNGVDADVTDLSGAVMGNFDGPGTARPKLEDPAVKNPNTLADVAKYFYDTDLRDPSRGSQCTSKHTKADVCENNVAPNALDKNTQQHMVTFTLGFGLDGRLTYSPSYLTDTSGDYKKIVNGTKNWPKAVGNTETAVDDLWHAAVNGNGKYFSATDPASVSKSISETITTIISRLSSGSASAVSTLRPVDGDNFAYVASYATGNWLGNLEARSIDVTSGEVAKNATWCVEDVVADSCDSGTLSQEISGSSTTYYCTTTAPTQAACGSGGVFDADAATCTKEVSRSCSGTMKSLVSASSDRRNIYMKDVKNNVNTFVPFRYSNMSTAQQAYFSQSYLSTKLSQWSILTTDQKNLSEKVNLLNFIRGQREYENEVGNTAAKSIFRDRIGTLGDLVESAPVFISKPTFSYSDPGYTVFKTNNLTRRGMIYVGANDGMLHAFNGSTGAEEWAYVPSVVIPNLWALADANYAINHKWFVNGDPVVSDICVSNCASNASAEWKTILVGGLRGGGSAFYAIDITDPDTPSLLWEFTTANDADMGLSYGNPIITKKANGDWVVLLTSGYNNVTGGNAGKGVLYVVNPTTGAIINKYVTSAGSAATPSNMSNISAYADASETNNQALSVYSGDMLGNVWKFDINSGASSTNPLKLTTLVDAGGVAQPITSRMEIGRINNYPVLFVGTGKYVESADTSSISPQSFYSIMDKGTGAISDIRGSLVQQTLTADGSKRTVSSNSVDYNSKLGWYVDFPDSGERSVVKPQLVSGVILVPTVVPSASACKPGGYGYLNYFSFKEGRPVDTSTGSASLKTTAPIVGVNVMFIGKDPVVSIVTSDNPTPQRDGSINFKGVSSGFQYKRSSWREMFLDQ